MMKNPVEPINAVLITGPTASGKSALAVRMAREHDGVVINADSMQVYDVLRVLTARPSLEDMQGIPHYLYGHVPPDVAYSTGAWLRDVAALLPTLHDQGKMPVFVGGTGLYFKALLGGLPDMPAIPDDIREGLRQRLITDGAQTLYHELQKRDAPMAAQLNPQDGQRIVRALEVLDATGQSLRVFQTQMSPALVHAEKAEKFVVLPERTLLHQRINGRFAKMLEGGALDEVKTLLALRLDPRLPAMRAIGVSQITAMLKGDISAHQAQEQGAAATRQYAKRQMTWFRHQMDETWKRIG